MIDWQTIKTEYITQHTSYRKLAEKHGVTYSVLAQRAKEEDWMGQRDQYQTKTQSITLEKLSRQEANRAAKIYGVADKLLLKIERMADGDKPLASKDIRALTAAVRDLKEIHGVKTDLERREQEAKIAALNRQAEKENTGKEPIRVEIVEELEEYCG